MHRANQVGFKFVLFIKPVFCNRGEGVNSNKKKKEKERKKEKSY